MDDRDAIYYIISNNLDYKKNNSFDYTIAQKIAWQLGFTSYIAEIIRNVFLRVSITGNKEEDVIKLTEEVIKAIWQS